MKFDFSGLTRIGSVGRSGWVTSRYLTCQLLFRYCFLFVSLTLSGPKFIVTTSTSIKAFHSLSEKNAAMTGHAQLGIQILDGGKALLLLCSLYLNCDEEPHGLDEPLTLGITQHVEELHCLKSADLHNSGLYLSLAERECRFFHWLISSS